MLIAGPSLRIDRRSAVPALRPGEVLRLADVTVTPGGSGLDVARAAIALGAPGVLVAFLPGHTGRAAGELIADEGIALTGVPVAGEIRSTCVIDEPGRATLLDEPPPPVDEGDWAAFEAAVAAGLNGHRTLVCAGSLPPGAPGDGYARLVRAAREAGRASVIEAGDLAPAAGADVVVSSREDAAATLVAPGARSAVVTAAVAAALEAGAGVDEAVRRGAAAAGDL